MLDVYENPNVREMIHYAFESMPGVVVTDVNGRIVYINGGYCEILKIDRKEAIGQYVEDVIPCSRMHIVAQTGQEEMGAIFKLKNGESVLVNRLPIWKDGKVIGAFAFGSLARKGEMNTTDTIERVRRLSQELSQYKSELNKMRGAKYSLDQIIGFAPSIKKIKELIKKVAQTRSTVLITGETGTGKELVAHAIHQLSPRSHHSFVRVNCAAIPPDLLESELFGYEEGAFTGAKKSGKLGKFELANYGTLLLDEINQMPLYLQSKLLRVIQEKEIEKVGGSNPVEVDVRLIFTTNQNLLDLVNKGDFREDLYYRINVVCLDIPPLRVRKDDIPLLTSHFIAKINKDLGLNINGIDNKAVKLFQSYYWPGNVRELEHILERAANIVLSGTLSIDDFENLTLRMQNELSKPQKDAGLANKRAQAEKDAIIEVLAKTDGNVKLASQFLKIHRSVLYDKIKKYEIKL